MFPLTLNSCFIYIYTSLDGFMVDIDWRDLFSCYNKVVEKHLFSSESKHHWAMFSLHTCTYTHICSTQTCICDMCKHSHTHIYLYLYIYTYICFMCVCVCVCVYLCLCVRVYEHVYTHAYIHVCTHVTYMCVTHMVIYMLHICVSCTHVHVFVCIHVHLHTNVCMCTHHMYMCVLHIYTCVRAYTFTFTCVCTYMIFTCGVHMCMCYCTHVCIWKVLLRRFFCGNYLSILNRIMDISYELSVPFIMLCIPSSACLENSWAFNEV